MQKSTTQIKDFFNQMAEKWDEYSGENTQLLEGYIDLLDIKKGDKVIDLACGTGVVTKHLAKSDAEKIIAIDISENMIEIANSKIQSQKIDFIADDFLTREMKDCDSLIMYNALPHFKNRSELAKKISSSLKVGGLALICHGLSRCKINSCHKNVMNISSHLESPEKEFENYKENFKLLDFVDTEEKYYFLIKKVK